MMVSTVALKLWLWFWHLLPANPILVRVVYGASRRPRHLWLRVGYLGALLFVVLFSLIASISGENASLTELAKGASQTFKWASMAQLLLMCFLAPVFTASAITQERDAQTFNILLSTPLSSAQIVLGSLMSRLYFVINLLFAGLPIFLMTMVYGGVTTRQIMESFALSGSTAVLTALAIFVAMIGVGTRRTIFSFYLLIALYLLALYMLGQWDRTWISAAVENVAGVKMSWLAPLHPFLALDVALNRVRAPSPMHLGDYGSLSRYALAYPSAVYVVWTTLLALLLVTLSMLFVRRGVKTGESTFLVTLLAHFGRKRNGERTRPPRTVWANPVAWREAKTRASGGALLRWTIIVSGLVGSFALYLYYVSGELPAAIIPGWLAGITITQFALALLIATNTAATSMTKEKESKTMDLLMTTPLTSHYVLWGKLRGLVSFAAPLLAGPVVVLLWFALDGVLRRQSPPVVWMETAFEIAALMVIYTAVVCVIGLRFSLSSRTNMIAVMTSVGTTILLCGFATMIGFAVVNASEGEFGAFLAPFTPFTSIHYLIDPSTLFRGGAKQYAAGAAVARTAALVGSVLAIAVYAFIVWRGYAALVRDFDMTLRKQSSG